MRRGTTPTHTFTTDVELSEAVAVYVTYQQRGKTLVEKTLSDITFGVKSLSVELSQRDTLKFAEGERVRIQIRAKFQDDTAIASQVINTTTEEILKEGEI